MGVAVVAAFFWSAWAMFRRLAKNHADPVWRGVCEGGVVCLMCLAPMDPRMTDLYRPTRRWPSGFVTGSPSARPNQPVRPNERSHEGVFRRSWKPPGPCPRIQSPWYWRGAGPTDAARESTRRSWTPGFHGRRDYGQSDAASWHCVTTYKAYRADAGVFRYFVLFIPVGPQRGRR